MNRILRLWRWIDIKLGGPESRCFWDGHEIDENPDALIGFSQCRRCDRLVRYA